MNPQKRRQKRNREIMLHCILLLAGMLVITASVFGIIKAVSGRKKQGAGKNLQVEAPDYTVELLTPNQYSRPQTKTDTITGIVVHYTANPGTTAEQNRNYFEGLKDSRTTQASSHFIIGIEGEIIQCIPTNEIAYASNERNHDTISIECCHKEENGEFTKETYDSLVELCAFLCEKFSLTEEDIIRHYDITGKKCPLYYVENPKKWKSFKEDVGNYMRTYGK